MQSMQRSFGKLLNKGPGDNAKVSVMLNDFDDADKVLVKIIDSAKSWRDAWISLATTQLGVVTEYEGLYDPIVGATDGHGKEMAQTPPDLLNRTLELCKAYKGLKDELLEEASQIDVRVIKPATDARDCIQPIRKTIKKRENKRFDYEKQQEKVNKLSKKPGRTAKEESQLSKAQDEMANLAEEFHIADAHLRETLPPIVSAAFSLIPPLLGAHVMVQNKLLGLYYTILNQYCVDFGFPSPPPPMEQVIADWSRAFKPVQVQVEAIGCVKRGSAVHLSMRLNDDQNSAAAPGRRLTAPALDNTTRRSSAGLIQSSPNPSNGIAAANAAGARTMRIPSMPSPRPPSPSHSPAPTPGFAAHLRPTDFTTASVLGQDPSAAPAVVRPRPLGHAQTEFFGHQTQSAVHVSPLTTPQSSSSGSSTFGSMIKKKPPPPPPPKRIPSATRPPEEFVVALYPFAGQGSGDLVFEAGDRIKIVRKTDKEDDWWEGELGGVRGSFPANYCQAA